METPNALPDYSNMTELPDGVIACRPPTDSPSNTTLLDLLIGRLDELTRPRPRGKLK
ncbi:hypothetical protein ACTXL8_05345 [Glutamicibacter arilaitensis]|uniref:hypothetical protein n=1 Tax=Glutamicibacter arilaitensis TaxID=256701 RepID=UPI003FD4D0DB